jgi:hypothetical protein
MLVIVGLSVVIGAAIAHAASAKAAHPPTENMRARLSPLGVDRRDVPLSDHGRCGGAAQPQCSLAWLSAHHGRHTRRAAAHIAFTRRAHDTRLQHQQRADTAVRHP